MTTPALLLCDDDPEIWALVSRIAEGDDIQTTVTSNFGEFTAAYSSAVDIIMLDLQLPGVDGIEIIRHLARCGCRAGIIVASAVDERLVAAARRLVSAQGLRLLGSLRKPFSPDALRELLREGTRRSRPDPAQMQAAAPSAGIGEVIEDEFIVLFQPKIDFATLRCESVEALVRWQHPELGMLGPESFVPLAERSGNIGKITDVVVDKALAAAESWRDGGLPLSVAINVSSQHLESLDLPDRLARLVARHDLKTEDVLLEVTETWVGHDTVAALDTLTRFRLKGFGLSIDDFGTGYSTLKKLSRIPFSELKLDQSFVHMAPFNTEAHAILRSSTELAHELGMRVVAEGVESHREWAILDDLDCDAAQGYLIAAPMPRDEIPGWVRRWHRHPRDDLGAC